MGCETTNATREKNCTYILKIDVSKVPLIPEDQKESFISKYLSEEYIHPEDADFQERLNNGLDLMYARWEWLQNNPEIYVNMLRVKGYSDERIQDCLDGKRPLSYPTKELHLEFKRALKQLKIQLEDETHLKNIRFVQTGSSVAGYSANPLKGFPDRPSKISDWKKTEVDIVIIADGVTDFVKKLRAEGKTVKEYPCVVGREIKFKESRYGNKNLDEINHRLKEFEEAMAMKIPSIHFTLQDGNPKLPPWELPIDIDNLE